MLLKVSSEECAKSTCSQFVMQTIKLNYIIQYTAIIDLGYLKIFV